MFIVWLLAPGVSSDNNGDHVLEIDQSLMEGPFAKFFAEKGRSSSYQKQSGMSPEKIKDAAKEILRCCREGLSEEEERQVPSLRLNYDDVLTAWSDRGDPWVDFKRAADDSNSTVCITSHSPNTLILNIYWFSDTILQSLKTMMQSLQPHLNFNFNFKFNFNL